jgi:putative endonuclease
MYARHEFGKFAENAVSNYLQEQGLKLKETNYQCRLGEVDLIMYDKDILVFIEVRARQNEDFLTCLESINRQKQRKIINTAMFYLQENKLLHKKACRFDVVAVNLCGHEPTFHWIKQAFEV